MQTIRFRNPWNTIIAALLTLTALSCADYPAGASKNRSVIVPDMSFDAAEDTVLTVAADTGVFNQIEEADPTTWTVATTGTLATTGPSDCEDCEKGSVEMAADGSFTYTPADDFEGNDYLYITVASDTGGEGEYIILFAVAGSNDPPTAVDDSAETDEDAEVTITPLSNDADIDLEDTFAMVSVGDPEHGSTTADVETGEVAYTPAANYFGEDSFAYVIADAAGVEATGTVTVTVNPVNDAPTAQADTYAGDEDAPLVIDAFEGVLSNDTDIEDDTDALTVTAGTLATAEGGSVEMQTDGSFTYTPTSDFHGTDSFSYILTDTGGSTAEGTATIAVAAVNDTPSAGADNYTTDEDTPLNVAAAQGVLVNDSDPENDALTVRARNISFESGSSVNLAADGGFTYTPGNNFNGQESFTYTLIDANGGRADGTVTLAVAPVNDAPVAHDDDSDGDIQSSEAITINVLANDVDIDNDPLTISQINTPAKGTASPNAAGNGIVYTPTGNSSGTDTFTYRVSDGTVDSNLATVTVYYFNDRPEANDDSYPPISDPNIEEDTEEISLDVLANDKDPDGDSAELTIQSVSGVSIYTTVSISPTRRSILYKPNQNYPWFEGSNFYVDTFTYEILDSAGGSDTAVVTVIVYQAVAPPEVIVLAHPPLHQAEEDETFRVNANSGVLAEAGSAWSVSTTAAVETLFGGNATVSGNGGFDYAPPPHFSGADSFAFTATDNGAPVAEAQGQIVVAVAPVNDAPLAQADHYAANGNLDISADQGLLHNDLDLEGDTLTVTDVDDRALSGTLSWQPDGAFTYAALSGGSESFSYTVSDGGATRTASVTITIGPENVPFAAADSYTIVEDTPLTVGGNGVRANDSGGTSAEADATSNFGGSVSMDAGGGFSYTPPLNFSGTDSFFYQLSDGGTQTVNGLVRIDVSTAPDAPLAGDDFFQTGMNTPISIGTSTGLLANDNDADGDSLTVTTTNSIPTDEGGSAEIAADGSFTYVPPTDFTGTDRFDYSMDDGNGLSDAATVIVTVSP